MLLIDEIDRADDEFEAFLLEVLSDFQITIPEIGTITAKRRPAVILTSNRTRELHDALKRRCLFHWITHPPLEREIEIVRLRVPGVPERLAAEAAAFVAGLRGLDLAKAPGVAETIDWAHALAALGCEELDAEVVEQTLGSVLKYYEDFETVRDDTVAELLREARDSGGGDRVSDALTRHVVTFGRVLREAGLEIGPGRLADALNGLDRVDVTRQDDVYWTLRTTLVARREELDVFDRAFDAWFLRQAVRPPNRRDDDPRRPPKRAQRVRRDAQAGRDAAAEGEPDEIGTSAHEVLRRKDFAAMSPEEFAAARKLISRDRHAAPHAALAPAPAPPPGTRPRHAGAGARRASPRAGTPSTAASAGARETPRKLVVLCDVSGSMEAYTRALLLYLHATVRSGAASRSSPSGRG